MRGNEWVWHGFGMGLAWVWHGFGMGLAWVDLRLGVTLGFERHASWSHLDWGWAVLAPLALITLPWGLGSFA